MQLDRLTVSLMNACKAAKRMRDDALRAHLAAALRKVNAARDMDARWIMARQAALVIALYHVRRAQGRYTLYSYYASQVKRALCAI